jgi:hypothetical protein
MKRLETTTPWRMGKGQVCGEKRQAQYMGREIKGRFSQGIFILRIA